ncbi:13360_t:CDS:2, partial [Gigaspora rosea]
MSPESQQEIADKFMKRYPDLKVDHDVQAENTFRHRSMKYPMLELAMNMWIERVTAEEMILLESLIKEKGHQFAQALAIFEESLAFSNGWITRFKKCNGLKKTLMHGEAASAPLASLSAERIKLRELLSHYSSENIYNADETGLFYRLLPNQTLSNKKKVTGKKKPLVIGTSTKPRSFNGINISQLPVTYRNNEKAWMRNDIWKNWLKFIDNGFHIQGRKVLLLIDNTASHITPGTNNTARVQDGAEELLSEIEDQQEPQRNSRG